MSDADRRTCPVGSPLAGGFFASRVFIYGALLFWAFICLFPIYWTITTSFKTAVNVTQGHLDPLGRLPAGLARLALARPVAGHDRRRPRPCATNS